EIYIEAKPEKIFSAITTPEELTSWWGDESAYQCDLWTVDLRVGGRFHSEGKGSGANRFVVEGTYMEIQPPNLLVYTWEPSWHQIPPTTVRWELIPQGSGTLVKITHSGFAGNVEALNDHKNGWPAVAAWLKRYVTAKAVV
ncbi:MAG TPA: SRPBCC domain-containing protein, partial [Acidobacteriota bacterium]|nr:SRPBCC domain-containing protein [Acidobacteriota bacterium]